MDNVRGLQLHGSQQGEKEFQYDDARRDHDTLHVQDEPSIVTSMPQSHLSHLTEQGSSKRDVMLRRHKNRNG
jgi:hypothetical protein